MLTILYLLFLANLLLACNFKRSIFVSVITFIFTGILFCLNTGESGDHYLYKLAFENSESGVKFEGVFLDFIDIVTKYIVSYNYFLLLIFVLCSILIYIGLRGFRFNIHAAFALCIPYIIPSCAVTIRFTIGLSLFIWGLRYLLKNKVVLFVVLVIAATAFHFSMIFALLFLWFKPIREMGIEDDISDRFCEKQEISYKNLNLYFVIVIAISFIFWVLRDLSFVRSLFYYFDMLNLEIDNKWDAYMTTRTKFGLFLFVPSYFLSVLFSSYIIGSVKKRVAIAPIPHNFVCLVNWNYFITKTSVFAFILLSLNLTFSRLLFVTMVFNSLVMSCMVTYARYLPKQDRNRISFLFLLLVTSWFLPSFFGVNSIGHNQLIDTAIEFLKEYNRI